MAGQTVYVDLTFLTNVLTDFVLVWLTSVVAGVPARMGRIIAAALAGAIYATASLLFTDIVFFSPVAVLLFPGVMTAIAFCPLPWTDFVRCCGFLLGLSFLAGGTILAVANLGVVPVSFTSLPLGIAVVLGAGLAGYRWFMARSLASHLTREIEIQVGEHRVRGRALIDTGNLLTDPLTGQPAIVAELDWVSPCIPEVAPYLTDGGSLLPDDQRKTVHECAAALGIRFIPFHSVGHTNGTLLAIKADQVIIRWPKGEIVHQGALVALAAEHLSLDHSFQAIIPASMG